MEEHNLDWSFVPDRIKTIKESLPEGVTLVAVSKTHPAAAIQAAYDAGQRVFGENKVQEMTAKYNELPKDIEWHFIGHVQKNKIRQMAPYVSMIHGIDSYDALAETNRQAEKNGRVIDCLLQLHVAAEETKFGFAPEECTAMLEEGRWRDLKNVRICGVMGMATNTDDEQRIRQDFQAIYDFYTQAKARFFADADWFSRISAGMSGDYEIAVCTGCNIVRIGSNIFGQRYYPEKSN